MTGRARALQFSMADTVRILPELLDAVPDHDGRQGNIRHDLPHRCFRRQGKHEARIIHLEKGYGALEDRDSRLCEHRLVCILVQGVLCEAKNIVLVHVLVSGKECPQNGNKGMLAGTTVCHFAVRHIETRQSNYLFDGGNLYRTKSLIKFLAGIAGLPVDPWGRGGRAGGGGGGGGGRGGGGRGD